MNAVRSTALILVLAAGSPAAAQVLQCKTSPMGTTYCNNTPGRVAPTLPTTGGGIIPGGPVGVIPPVGIDAQLSGGRAQAQADRLGRERIARAQVVSDLIVQGRCSEAQAVAMNAGDYAMANKAMGICRQ